MSDTPEFDFVVYETSTGEIAYTGTNPEWQIHPLEVGQTAIQGVGDSRTQKVVDGVVVDKTEAEKAPHLNFERKREIFEEQTRRTRTGFTYNGKLYDFDVTSQGRIDGAATLANSAIMGGAQVGDLRWHGGASDFMWITADNSFVPMDAQTMLSLGQAAAEHVRAHIFAARVLKDDPTITDVIADIHWP